MMRYRLSIGVLFSVACVTVAAAQQPAPKPPPATPAAAKPVDLTSAISNLGSFDFPIRTEASMAVRRANPKEVAPALEAAVRSHADEYVRFRALVILGGFQELSPSGLMRDMMGDRNDRLRTVAYQWFEHHPDPALLPTLLAALGRERSEFVRPALTRAIAAHGSDPRAQAALVPLIVKGEDLFRGALIEAIGDYKGSYALARIIDVAKLDGPLQDDAVTALGKIGDVMARPVLAGLQKTAPREVQPTISAAFCLLDIDCERQEAYLKQMLQYAIADEEYQPLLRGVAHALGMLAARGRTWALTALLDAGIKSTDPARAPLALAVGLVALRDPLGVTAALETRKDTEPTVVLIRDAFDMLSEDFEEERFYAAIRSAYWSAAPGSARRRTTDLLIERLEF